MAIFIMDRIAPEAVTQLRQQHEVVDFPASRERDWCVEAEALIVRTFPVRAPELAQARRLKIVAKHGSGVDNIDLAAASQRGILVTNTPGANADAVAEYVLALALAVARRIPLSHGKLRDGAGSPVQDGLELGGKTLGLIGLGDIGSRTSRLFRGAFGAAVLAYDPYAGDAAFAAAGATRVADIDSILRQADVLSLHVPRLESTRHLIGAAQLAAMKSTAILINAARGGVVDEVALHAALRDGVIAGAGSDVFEVEPPPADHPLLDLPNFVGSPHVAGSSRDSLLRMGSGAAQACIDVLAGRQPAHLVRAA
ncbi:hydroxyacid dehydrogenase [Herbaspirillum sp. NPDC087042]|uniref:hydroxyacid dehydrogenase n=1 Tax=Herbaspirillum sp. NPDC087042 TaxID=3364004 RepID=UPI0037F3C268